MRLDQTLLLIKEGLDSYAEENSGRILVARDPFDVIDQLTLGPRGFVLVLHYAGGVAEDNELSEADGVYPEAIERIEVVVGTALGPDAARDWRLAEGRGGRPSLLERVTDVRALALALVFPDDGESLRRLAYEGCDPVVTPEGMPMAAYRLRFGLHVAIPRGTDEELDL